MGDDCSRLISKIERLRELLQRKRSKINAFGAEGHGWVFHPPLTETHVSAAEQRLRIELPQAYREFITRISSGGAGPAYGLLPFDSAIVEGGSLDIPFPWTEAHNPYDGGPDPSDEVWDAQAYGTLAICHEGCGHLHRLVVSGEARGLMWIDSRVSDGGFIPLGIDFQTWYERWLDGVLAGRNGAWWLG
jgi:hypothetical protein